MDAYVVVQDYGYEGLGIVSVWFDEEGARAEARELNKCTYCVGEEGELNYDCTCRHRVHRYPIHARHRTFITDVRLKGSPVT